MLEFIETRIDIPPGKFPLSLSKSLAHLFPHGKSDLAEPLNPDGLGIIGWQKKSKHYDFVANHMTYNFTFADEYFPTAKKISILRHPSTHMTSTWKYYFKPNMRDKEPEKLFTYNSIN